MKIRTIVGVLLVLVLILSSTGLASAAKDGDKGKGECGGDQDKIQDQIKDQLRDGSCQDESETILSDQDQTRERNVDDCTPDGDANRNGWEK